jgi:D-amino peptidase
MKIYINTDLEGVCGFVDWEEATFETGRGVGYTKQFLTAEVNAAIEGILQEDAGAEIVVQDGHGGGYWGPNIIAEELHPRASLILGKRGMEIAGLDGSFDLLMCVGAHSMAGTQNGLMNHTISHGRIMNVWIGGVRMGEIGIWASIAGYHGIPLGMLSGDHWAVEEARLLLGDIEGAAVKKGINMFTAHCLNPLEARKLIKEAAVSAIKGRGRFKPYLTPSPAEIKIEFTSTQYADTAEINHRGERLDGRTVRFRGDDFISVLNQACL